MTSLLNAFLAGLAVIVLCAAAMAAAHRPSGQWTLYRFAGQGFVPGPAVHDGAFVAVRDGMRPAVLTRSARPEEIPLPPGSGALAGICYIQSSGGKLAPGPDTIPLPRTTVRISAGSRVVTTLQTDEQGYFVTVLPAGRYRIVSGIAAEEIMVVNNSTLLVPLRAGKRMVD